MRIGRRDVLAAAFALAALGRAGASGVDGAPPAGRAVRILTFNVLIRNRDHDSLAAFLDRTDPDVVFLQEAGRGWDDVLSRYPSVHRWKSLVTATRLFDPQPPPVRPAQGDARHLRVVGDFGARKVALYNFHPFSPRHRAGIARRQHGYARLTEALVAEPDGVDVLVAGDFNAVPTEPVFVDLLGATSLTLFDGGTMSVPTRFPRELGLPPAIGVPIDHVAGRGAFRLLSRTVGPDLGSDHLPVVVDVELG